MIVARYWSRATAQVFGSPVYAWGWSESDPEEAECRAAESVQRLAHYLDNADRGVDSPPSWYGYDARPAREEVVEEFHDKAGEVSAVVTRNLYGVLVLNTRDLAFVDADIPRSRRPLRSLLPGFLRRLLNTGPGPGDPEPSSPEDVTLQKIRDWSAANPDVGLRVYRTAAGFRGLVTNRVINAATAEADNLLSALPTDALYRRLCRAQECYRARLTPKPWRIGVRAPTQRYPWASEDDERAFGLWRRGYERASERFATCRLVERLGPDAVLPELRPLIELHDRVTRCDADQAGLA